jgi:hypothetical protein
MTLLRYERRLEDAGNHHPSDPALLIPYEDARHVLNESSLSPGSRKLVLGLLRTGTTRMFPGGGVGIEYGSLLKTAVRPDELCEHIEEAAAHLLKKQVDLLFVPGMSGYPIGAMYAYAAGIPAILLKKQKSDPTGSYPAGSFIIPSYTGDGDVVMSADLDAVRDIVSRIVDSRVAVPGAAGDIPITIRCAGADDIIDKAVMAHAITECAPLVCEAAWQETIARRPNNREVSESITCSVDVSAWVTPLIKTYNGPAEHLMRAFGIAPFAGVSISGVYLDPPAIGIEGAGTFQFAGG